MSIDLTKLHNTSAFIIDKLLPTEAHAKFDGKLEMGEDLHCARTGQSVRVVHVGEFTGLCHLVAMPRSNMLHHEAGEEWERFGNSLAEFKR